MGVCSETLERFVTKQLTTLFYDTNIVNVSLQNDPKEKCRQGFPVDLNFPEIFTDERCMLKSL